MAVNYKFSKGTDIPAWHWLSQFINGASSPGTGNAYDGVRYIYWAIQYGSQTPGTVGTAQLWRYDTWNDGWQFLAGLNQSTSGLDVEIDMVRGVVYITNGNTTTTLQVFNMLQTPTTIMNTVCAAFSVTSIALALPFTPNSGSSLTLVHDLEVTGTLTANGAAAIDSGTATAASTTTSLVNSVTPSTFTYGHIGCYARFTSGTLAGQRRLITAQTTSTLTTSAFTAAPAAGDTFVVEVPEGTASSGSTTTLVLTNAGWTANTYAFSDVIIIAGTGAGQRRRIASHDATTLTLATAVTGNPRTGPFTTAPDNTSVFRIVPSSDFLYLVQGGGQTVAARIDVVATTGTAWVTLAAIPAGVSVGGNAMFSGTVDPFGFLEVRGSNTGNIYRYLIGTNTWTTPLTFFFGGETINTGSSVTLIAPRRKIWVMGASTQRCFTIDLLTGSLDSAGFAPYAAPLGYEGHRSRYIRAASGVEWMYQMRAGGQELFRVALEWLI